MAAKYQAYPEYRNCGVEWIGSMPSGWCDYRIKFFAQINPSKQEARGLPPETEVTFLPMEAIGEKGELDTSAYKDIGALINGYTYVGENDVIIAKITPCFENGKGAIACGLKNGMAFATTEVIPLRVTSFNNSKFLYYLLSCDPFRKIAEGTMYGAGGQKRVSDGFVANYDFAKPSNTECESIANFLDHETAKIGNLIDKQQQMIKLLKEKRQAVISHAVTKGLNPDVRMKDSGVDWLGEVPEHWSTLRIKQIANFITSGPRGWSDFISEEGEDIFLQSGDLNNELEILPHKAKKVIAPKGAEGVRTKLIEGDVVVCITGANTGRVAVVQNLTATTYINQHLSLIRPNEDKVDARFIGYALSSQGGRAYFDVTQYGLKEGLSLTNVAEAPLPLPPLNEQKDIVQELHARLSVFSRINEVAENQVELLQERRSALISAAVTGKIDVRNWQPAQTVPSMEVSA